MRAALFAALLMLGTTACLRGTGGPDPDASSNGNNNNNNNGSNGNSTPDASTGNPTPDASTGSNGSNGGNPDAGTMSGPPCINKASSYPSGHHYPGQDCNGACHDHGFSLAGTLYTNASGSSVIAGATIVAKDAGGHTVQMVSGTNGNFYSTTPVSFPVTIYATECQISQTVTPMVSAVQSSSNGGCNSSGCHSSGGSQGRIHLP